MGTAERQGASLIRADALAIPLGDETVDCIVTSPPYFALRSYSDGGEHYDGQIGSEATPTAFLEALWAVTAECWRVLKPSGSLFVNLGDKYAGTGGGNGQTGIGGKRTEGATDNRSMPKNNTKQTSGYVRAKSLMGLPWRYAIGCIDGQADPDQTGWVLRSEIVWAKPNGLPESVTDRVRRSHEQWFHLTKCGTYYADVDPIREPHAPGSAKRYASGFNPGARALDEMGLSDRGIFNGQPAVPDPLGKLPDSVVAMPDEASDDSSTVWRIPTQPLIVPEELGDHFAAFPTEWPRRLISAWCPPDGIVLDPFGGTGTTAMVARALGRYGVSIDLSADYLRLADWRIWDSGQDAKVARRTAEQTANPAAAETAFTAAARLAAPDQLDIFAEVPS